MEYSQAERGRTFILRLEHGEILHEEIEKFAKTKNVKAGILIVVGGANKGSELVVGPENRDEYPVSPMKYILDDVHEAGGTGTLFPDEDGNPVVHIHISAGRNESTKTGCIREGVKVWEVMEIVLIELVYSKGKRIFDEKTGLKLLKPEGE